MAALGSLSQAQCAGSRRRRSIGARLIASIVVWSAMVCGSHGQAPPADSRQIGPFRLDTIAGERVSLETWRTSKAVLLFFISDECPVSNGYAPQMMRIVGRVAPQGVACYAVHCDASMTAETAKRHADEYGLQIEIMLDPEQLLATYAKVRVTPEAVVASAEGKILYRGRIDNRYSQDGKRRDKPTAHDLESALDAVIGGAEPTVKEMAAFGCPLPKLKARPGAG
jgi:peroxiredoxin